MAENPITTLLPADLPTNWVYGQTIAPDGSDVGLSKQHGYNYLMQQVNAAHTAIKDVGDSFPLLALKSDITLKTLGITATAKDLNYVKGVTGNIQTQLDKKLGSDGKAVSAKEADAAGKLVTLRNINGTPFDGTADINTKWAWNKKFVHHSDEVCVRIMSISKGEGMRSIAESYLIGFATSSNLSTSLYFVSISRNSKGNPYIGSIVQIQQGTSISFYINETDDILELIAYMNNGYYRGHNVLWVNNAYALYEPSVTQEKNNIDVSNGIPSTWKEIPISVLQDQSGTVENADKLKVTTAQFVLGNSYRIALPDNNDAFTRFNTAPGFILRMRNTLGSLGGNKGDYELNIGESNVHSGIIKLRQYNSIYATIIAPSSTANSAGNILKLPNKDGTFALTSDLGAYLPLTGGTLTGNITAPTFHGNVDGGIKNLLTNPTSTGYFIPFFSGSTNNAMYLPRTNDGIRYYTLEGTASALGDGQLCLGNSKAKGTAGNKRGRISLFGEGTGYTNVQSANASSTNYTITLPAATGTVALTTSTVSVANKVGTATKGSATKPVYINAGTPTVCSRDLVGMTMTGSVKPTPTAVTAGTGAEIFNDYAERTFNGTIPSTGNVASGNYSHAEGSATTASGICSHAEGYQTTASGNYSHAEGKETTALGVSSHAEGSNAKASGVSSHTEGGKTRASGNYSHAEGQMADATGSCSHAEGYTTIASGNYSHAGGYTTIANNFASFTCGKYSKELTTGGTLDNTTGDVFVIGKGTSNSSLANAVRITYAGKIYACASLSTSGADYAEFMEWEDGNPEDEDRVGYFVTMSGRKIRKAGIHDYIAGVTSGNPAVIGNGDEDWQGRYLHDEMNRPIKEEVITPVTKSVEKERLVLDENGNPIPQIEFIIDEETGLEVEQPVVDKEGNPVYETRIEIEEVETGAVTVGWRYKENPDYDYTKPYIERQDRPEWDCVGMVGVLPVYDDGTCQVNGFCKPAAGGIATAAESQIAGSTYRVIERVSESVIKIIFR